jgi:two-component system, chemotaxis family, CheB/CheR fusion protein
VRGNEPLLEVVWKESGGPPVKAPERTSLGSTLIERGIPGAKVEREYRPDGLMCKIEVPLGETTREARADGA